MESFKHSCPFCGQHIEYTVGYCGKQMQCPICGKTVTFPAIPPARSSPALQVKNSEAMRARRWLPQASGSWAFLRDFQHWNTVAQCAVPFLVIGALLVGAVVVKNKLGDAPAAVAIPAVQADPAAWQHMTDLARAEVAVKARMGDIATAHIYLATAVQARRQAEHAEPTQKKRAEEQLERAQNMLMDARQRFNNEMSNYRRLGGSIDYRSQITNY